MPPEVDARPLLLHAFSTFAVGGPQIRFCTLAEGLADRWRHLVFAMDDDFACASRLSDRVGWETRALSVAKGGGLSARNLLAFRSLLQTNRPAALVTYNWGTIEWCLATRFLPPCPHLHIEDGFGPEESPTRQLPRRVRMRRFALGGRTRTIVPSRTLERLALDVWKLNASRVIYLPNGIDCARFAAPPDESLRVRLGIAPGEMVVGTVAALRREKNLARLIEAMSAVPARLVIVGDGPERGALEALARTSLACDRIVFAGALAAPERVYGLFDVFAMSSDTEQMPTALLEAMAASRPAAATDVGDTKDLVATPNLPFIVGLDPRALADALCRLLSLGAAERAAIGRANQERARQDFDAARMIAAYDALFSAASTAG